MKKLFQIGAVLCCMLLSQYGFAQNEPAQEQMMTQEAAAPSQSQDVHEQVYTDGQCPADHPCGDQPTGDCWCMYVHYKPCYYTTKRCVEEQIPCQKRCCRMVPKYYEVERCKMVPQYYTETICRQEPEYYYVQECKTCKKYVCDRHCKYVPEYYWKHVCGNPQCETPCPTR